MLRWTAAGERPVFATLPARTEGGPLQWLNGLAAGPDGTIYYTENAAIRRVSAGGETSDGTVYVAASGCGAVLSITTRHHHGGASNDDAVVADSRGGRRAGRACARVPAHRERGSRSDGPRVRVDVVSAGSSFLSRPAGRGAISWIGRGRTMTPTRP